MSPSAKAFARALARQSQPAVLQVVVVVAQARHVDQAVDVELPQRDEEAEVRDSGDDTIRHFADALLHVGALVPRLHVPRRLLGPSLTLG